MSPKSDNHSDHADMHPVGKDSSNAEHFESNPPAEALTPPTSEDHNIKLETGSTSDLSDAPAEEQPPQVEDEEEEEIFPDHYYDGGKIPVFKPVSTDPHTLTHDVILIHSTDHETVSEFQRLCRED